MSNKPVMPYCYCGKSEVVLSSAGGKDFYYCRGCKKEVFASAPPTFTSEGDTLITKGYTPFVFNSAPLTPPTPTPMPPVNTVKSTSWTLYKKYFDHKRSRGIQDPRYEIVNKTDYDNIMLEFITYNIPYSIINAAAWPLISAQNYPPFYSGIFSGTSDIASWTTSTNGISNSPPATNPCWCSKGYVCNNCHGRLTKGIP